MSNETLPAPSTSTPHDVGTDGAPDRAHGAPAPSTDRGPDRAPSAESRRAA